MAFWDDIGNFFSGAGEGIKNFFTGNWGGLSEQVSNVITGSDNWSWDKDNNMFARIGNNIVNSSMWAFPDVVHHDDQSDIFKDWDSVDFKSMSEDEMRNWLLNHSSQLSPENMSIISGWLNDKYTANREDSQISRYIQQLKENGINPLMLFGRGSPAGIGSASGDTNITTAPDTSAVEQYRNSMLDMRFIALILAGLRLVA